MKLKSCPHCGCKVIFIRHEYNVIDFEGERNGTVSDKYSGEWRVCCDECGCGSWATSKEVAIGNWNRRVKEEEE